MTTKELNTEDAIRNLLNRTKPEVPSDDFTSRIMEKIEAVPSPARSWLIRYQWIVLITALTIAIIMLFFPIWSWFGIEFTPLNFFLYYTAEMFRISSVWIGEALSRLSGMGKMMYLLPVSVAMLLLFALDQALRRPSHKVTNAR